MKFNEMTPEKRRAIALSGSRAAAAKAAARVAAGLPARGGGEIPKPVKPMCRRGRHDWIEENIGHTRRLSGDGVVRDQTYCKACRRETTMARAARQRALRRDNEVGRS